MIITFLHFHLRFQVQNHFASSKKCLLYLHNLPQFFLRTREIITKVGKLKSTTSLKIEIQQPFSCKNLGDQQGLTYRVRDCA